MRCSPRPPVFTMASRKGLSSCSGFTSIQTLSSFCQRVKKPLVSFASLMMSLKGRGAPGVGAVDAAGAPGAVEVGPGVTGAVFGVGDEGAGAGVGDGAWALARVAEKAPATRLAPRARATASRRRVR